MVPRHEYINKLINSMWNNTVKVITGIRRCGKSVLLFNLFKNYLKDNGVLSEDIIEIKFDEMENFSLRNPFILVKYLSDKLSKRENKRTYIFLDEIQYVKTMRSRSIGISMNIFDILNGLNNKENVDLYVTGSNSKMLSSDIITEFRGRSTQIRVHPLSFKEYYDALGGDKSERLKEYLVYGGMPGLLNAKSILEKQFYLNNLFNETYLKDIVERNKIERTDLLDKVLDYLASNISSLTNSSKLAKYISSISHENVNSLICTRYLKSLIDSFILSEAKRFDIKGKKYFEFPSKFYFEDLGLRNARLNFRQIDEGHLMKNLIYNEFLRKGFDIDVGVVIHRTSTSKNYYEVDFVLNRGDKKIYVQSSYKLDDQDKKEQEIRSFNLIKDNFQKIIIRNDISISHYDENGIYNLSLLDFLLNNDLAF